MKYNLLIIIVLLLISCSSKEKQSTIPTIDVTKTYPKKEIALQDIADVQYIPLETRNDVLIDRDAGIINTEKNVVVFNRKQGDIFFFNEKGEFKYKFNHKGQSGEEYIDIADVFVSEKEKEVIVVGGFSCNNVQVYNLKGKYKRTFELNKGIYWLSPFYDFNSKEFIFHKKPNTGIILRIKGEKKINKPQMAFINKITGKIDTIIKVPCTEGVNSLIIMRDGDANFVSGVEPAKKFVPTPNGILVNEVGCDTTFVLNKGKKLIPILARIPKVSPKDNPLKMLGVDAVSKNAIYFTVMDKKYVKGGENNYPTKKYIWDKKQKQFFEYSLKKNALIGDNWQENRLLPVDAFKELLEEGKLNGELKTIAENLKEDDNPVLMKVMLK